MKPKTRLTISWGIVLVSAAFGILVAMDRHLAESVALWYIPTILTLIMIINVWKRVE